MFLSLLIWIDIHILHCRWRWFCAAVWDKQLERDAKSGKLDRLFDEAR